MHTAAILWSMQVFTDTQRDQCERKYYNMFLIFESPLFLQMSRDVAERLHLGLHDCFR
jgi:hypothetical protein